MASSSSGALQVAVDARMIHHSGIGTYIRNILPRLIPICPADTVFHLLGNAGKLSGYPWARSPNVKLIDCIPPIYSIAEQYELASKIPGSADVFWSPHYNIPVLNRTPLMVTIHDACHLAMPEYLGSGKRLYARLMFSAVKRRARDVICVSGFTAREMVRLTGIDQRKLHIVPSGVSEEWFTCKPDINPHPKPYVLYVGNVKPHKNLAALISAFELISNDVQHDLIIVGKKEGFLTGDETVAAKAAALGERVVFTGQVQLDLLQQYYLHAECLILPSLYEGFGFPAVEAMACGCPVIVSDIASLPEVCGDAALYCDPHSSSDIAAKLALLLGDESLRDVLRAKGRERAKSFTWENAAKQTLAVLLGTSRPET